MTVHAFSFGGGVQSTAALVLAAQGKLPATDDSYRWDAFLFANVGDDSEHPDTLRYVAEYAIPYAEDHGVAIHEVAKLRRDGTRDDLLGRITRAEHSTPIPVRLPSGAPARRACTSEFKIRPVMRELKNLGATPDEPAIVGIGISMDEIQRAKHWGERNPREPSQIMEYPLLRLGLRRRDCLAVVADAGLPQPPRSACWFCPWHSLDEWRRLKRESPDLFDNAVALERMMNDKRAGHGKQPVWLTDYGRPLDQVVQDQLVLGLDDPGTDGAPCDTGSCFT